MAGKYAIGVRVQDEDGDVGTIVGKRKGERLVEYGADLLGIEVWVAKSFLTPLAANDDAPAPAERERGEATEAKFKVGDRVRATAGHLFRTGIEVGDEGVITGRDDDCWTIDFIHPTDGKIKQWARSVNIALIPEPATDWQPKVGDRVRFKTEAPQYGAAYCDGDLTVHSVLSCGKKVGVTYPYFGSWTDCHLTQVVAVSDIEPLPVTAEAQPAGDESAAGIDEDRLAAVASATATFKVGDRVRVKGGSMTGTVATRSASGAMSFVADGDSNPGPEFWYDDELVPAAPTPVTKGTTVQLSGPAIVTRVDKHHAHLLLATGGAYTLPVAALTAA